MFITIFFQYIWRVVISTIFNFFLNRKHFDKIEEKTITAPTQPYYLQAPVITENKNNGNNNPFDQSRMNYRLSYLSIIFFSIFGIISGLGGLVGTYIMFAIITSGFKSINTPTGILLVISYLFTFTAAFTLGLFLYIGQKFLIVKKIQTLLIAITVTFWIITIVTFAASSMLG